MGNAKVYSLALALLITSCSSAAKAPTQPAAPSPSRGHALPSASPPPASPALALRFASPPQAHPLPLVSPEKKVELPVDGSTLPASTLPGIPVVVEVASVNGVPVVDKAWVAERLAIASERFSFTQRRFEVDGYAPASAVLRDPGLGGDILSVAQRNSLARQVHASDKIYIFVVDQLGDKDRKNSFISGVHWHYSGGKGKWRGRRYIILSRFCRIDTLAHELGHYFGLAHTSPEKNTLMTSPQRGLERQFTKKQREKIKVSLVRFLRRSKRRK